MRVPKVLQSIANPVAPVASYVASPVLVGLIAWVVDFIERLIGHTAGHAHPNLILFLLPIALLTLLGGRGPGLVTVILSALASSYILIEPRYSFAIDEATEFVGLILMLLTGFIIVIGLDFMRNALRIQAHAAEELARLHSRAQRIASAFQEPLIPKVPGYLPGLAIAHYYKPALDEASVGGDFLDIFETGNGDSVLVLGDISGKGLSAATQIPTVRSMLRLALHRSEPSELAAVIDKINDAVAGQDLLGGFATLFVAMYDSDKRTLTYVSCGHEPAILKQTSAREAEMLPPTGPILGPFPGSRYVQEEWQLHPGDTIVIYTDGLSDCGPDRAHMLGGEGLKRLLSELLPGPGWPGGMNAGRIVRHIIDGTRAHAQGHLSDDACLVVCTVAPMPSPLRPSSNGKGQHPHPVGTARP